MKKRNKLVVAAGSTVALGALATTITVTAADSGAQRTAASAGAAAATVWPLVQGTPGQDTGTSLSSIATTPDGTMWASGSRYRDRKPALQRLSNGTWTNVGLPASLSKLSLNSVTATSASDVWVAGQLADSGAENAIGHWNGKAWRTFTVPYQFQSTGIAARDTRNVWAVSYSGAKYWNGTAWADTPIGIRPRAVAASPGGAWAVGTTGPQPAAARWNGSAWVTVPFPEIAGTVRGEIASSFHDVLVVSDDDVWAVGAVQLADASGKASSRSLFAHWNGTKWTHTIGDPRTAFTEITSDGAGGMWIMENQGVMRHRAADGTWSTETVTVPAGTTPRINDMAVRPGTRTVWAVGATSTTATGWADLAHWRSN
ncbi:hypothetical protein [Actinomadura sp. 9N407]|uniref:hypothetical protein n=1 Tax=Actinomadura sp. 9N407 TaxID=3375154 RepID=UPI0037A2B266